MTTLGWIGMGAIGTPMALKLLDAGHELIVWGRNAQRLAVAIERGARAVGSPAEVAAACEAVMLCVTDTDAVEAVVFGPGGVAEGGAAGTLVVDHSTIDPDRSRSFAQRLRAERQIGWLDAPVSGGAAGARAGTLTILIGGDVPEVERARPWLECYGSHITHVGEAGFGQAAKSCSQAVFGVTIAVWTEVLAYARAIGLDPNTLVAALEGSWSDSPVRTHIVPHLVRNLGTASTNNLLQKDLAIVTDRAHAAGVEVPLTALAAISLRRR